MQPDRTTGFVPRALLAPLLASRKGPAWAAYCLARRAANLALLAWLAERPDPDDVAEEIEAGASIQRQMLRLALAGGVR